MKEYDMAETRIPDTITPVDDPTRAALLARAHAHPHWPTLHAYLVEQGYIPNEPAVYAARLGDVLVRHVVVVEYLAIPDEATLPPSTSITRKATLGFYVEVDGQMGVHAFMNKGEAFDYALQVTDTGIEELPIPARA